jgi:hypothetical protein
VREFRWLRGCCIRVSQPITRITGSATYKAENVRVTSGIRVRRALSDTIPADSEAAGIVAIQSVSI